MNAIYSQNIYIQNAMSVTTTAGARRRYSTPDAAIFFASFALYSWMVPGHTRMVAPSWGPVHSQISLATWSMSRKSCETTTTPPSKSWMMRARASMAPTSRWLVGSSSLGAAAASQYFLTRTDAT